MTETIERGELLIPNDTGDLRVMWDPRDKDETKAAKAAYDDAVAKGMRAYTVEPDGSTGEVIREFPKKAGKLQMVAQLQGG